jgi:hypothetical protein
VAISLIGGGPGKNLCAVPLVQPLVVWLHSWLYIQLILNELASDF